MEHLENQSSDLRSFLMPPGLLARSHTGTPLVMSPPRSSPHAGPSSTPRNYGGITIPSAADSPVHIGTVTPRRKRARAEGDDNAIISKPLKQREGKRNRVQHTECKRRKIKCSGETPCGRCGHLGLTCLYSTNCCAGSLKDSDEFRQMADQVARLQGQFNTLFNAMNTIRQEMLRLAPIHQPVAPLSPSVPPMTARAAASPAAATPLIPSIQRLLPSIHHRPSFSGPTSTAFSVDMAETTLHSMGYAGDESDGDGDGDGSGSGSGTGNPDQPSPSMKPMPTPDPQRPTNPLWEYSKDEMVRLCGLYEQEVGVMYPFCRMEDVLKHVEALRSWMDMVERTGFVPPLGQRDDCMSSNALPSLNLKIILCCALVVEQNGNSDKAIRLFDSMRPTIYNNGYRLLCNEELLAWRTMGQVMRLFSGGLPFSISDDKIDPKLPLPDDFPYLVAMVGFSRLAAKVWSLVDYFEPTLLLEFNRSDYDNLDHQILNWYSTVPAAPAANERLRTPALVHCSLRIEYADPNNIPMLPILRGRPRLIVWIRLRLNQIRIWLLTPVLHCATSINANLDMAERVVHIAKQSIRFLAALNEQTDLYRYSQIFYHQFLTSSIAVLFLASTHAPLQFNASCRDEFYRALELCLWRTIKSLKRYAARLGMEEPSAGVAGGGAAMSSGPAGASSRESSASVPLNGHKLQAEVARIFEGYLKKGGEMGEYSGGVMGERQYGGSVIDNLGGRRTVTASVFQQMREMY
ncbi:fungal-specific transcription factor domain-containing protein [Podospora appendiculata]|uniref:Fungal-specific transcription factor domain-containing protein n=1 Tax=Podospora appendiculata TaxID=314037 RepID=A0AAE0X0L2_9PEZI|nr:fungal-specific transcription factor domain-containing protein [Podospora appendiculata]